MSVPDDCFLIGKCVDGNINAFEELVGRYQKKVYTLAFLFSGNHSGASHIARESFVLAFGALSSFKGDRGFDLWLLRIASSFCRGYNAGEGKPEREPKSLCPDVNKSGSAQDYLLSLPCTERLVLILRDVQGFSYAQIAYCLDCAINEVKHSIRRGRELLRRSLLQKEDKNES